MAFGPLLCQIPFLLVKGRMQLKGVHPSEDLVTQWSVPQLMGSRTGNPRGLIHCSDPRARTVAAAGTFVFPGRAQLAPEN